MKYQGKEKLNILKEALEDITMDYVINIFHDGNKWNCIIGEAFEWFRKKDLNSMGFHETITIERKDFKNWSEIAV